jgi:hypothetical protein
MAMQCPYKYGTVNLIPSAIILAGMCTYAAEHSSQRCRLVYQVEGLVYLALGQ